MVAHNAPFDRRVLRQACERIGLDWPDPPVICTAALARTLLPLQRERKLGQARRCARDRGGARAPRAGRRGDLRPRAVRAVAAAVRPCRDGRRRDRAAQGPAGRGGAAAAGAGRAPARRVRPPRRRRRAASPAPARSSTSPACPATPGVYLFRDDRGRTLYVGKSVSIRSRARAHFAPSTPRGGLDRARDDRRLPGDALRARSAGAREPADQGAPPAGQHPADPRRRPARLHPLPARHPVSDPRGRAGAGGRPRASRSGRCAAGGWRWSSWSSSTRCSRCATAGGPCRAASIPRPTVRWAGACRRAWAIWTRTSTAAGSIRRCRRSWSPTAPRPRGWSSTWTRRCARAAAEQRYERAVWLRRRARRLRVDLRAPRGRRPGDPRRARALVLAPHPARRRRRRVLARRRPAGRLGPAPARSIDGAGRADASVRCATPLGAGDTGAHVPPEEVDEVRILGSYLLSHPDIAAARARARTVRRPRRWPRFVGGGQANGSSTTWRATAA